MNINNLFKDIITFCEKNADDKLVKKYSRYFKDEYIAYGIPFAKLEEQFNKWKIICTGKMNFEEAKKLGDMLFENGKYECGVLAVKFFLEYKNEYRKKDLSTIKKWLDKYITNWAHTDYMCMDVLKIFLQNRIIGYIDLENWKNSKSIWTRRAVPVSLIKILNEEKISKLVEFISPLIDSPERPVHQGVGWFLREAWKREPRMVEKFLLKIKDYAPRTIVQYATEKMSKEERLKYKAVK